MRGERDLALVRARCKVPPTAEALEQSGASGV